MEESEITKKSTATNRSAVKRIALNYCHSAREWKPTEVSKSFLDRIEINTINAIKDEVNKHPSKGKTLM